MFELTSKGDWSKTSNFLKKLSGGGIYSDLDRWGRMGVEALAKATPQDTGLTAQSWEYRITRDARGPGIEWFNVNDEYGRPVAILIQYGHGTRNGGYVPGYDYINPAIKPIMDQVIKDIEKEVKNANS